MLNDDKIIKYVNDEFERLLLDEEIIDTSIDDLKIIEEVKQNNNKGENDHE